MIAKFHELRPHARLYISVVVMAGAFVIGLSVYQLVTSPISNQWLILAALTLLTGSFNVKVSSINAYISVSEAFVFASILLFGTPAGTATVVIECLVILLWMTREGRLLHRVLFNMAAPSVAVWTAGTAFYLLSGIQPYSTTFTPLPTLFLPLLAFTALYFLLNSWLVAIAVGLEGGRSPVGIWLKNFAWLSVNYFSGASLAALIVTYTKQLDFSSLAVIVPLLVVSYLTFRTAMGRAEDSYSHLSELNRLYLSTIETLAMAIDAKDQITHGHIRRVQAYAVGLAKAVGVTDEKLLKAIEAAALLHDMGKLAVPEHILNKPGKLTTAEFEKMKLHASFGADMLSAINFPYPVVPIVRHHHESWNGSGYPTGIRGTDIPIGARILSVVDCFDALTSDRPYRPKLSDEDAIAILVERRGTMYDPLVVDTFIRVHKDIAPSDSLVTESTASKSPRTPHPRLEPSVAEPVTPIATVIRPPQSGDVLDMVERRLRAQVPFSLAVVFLYDAAVDELSASYAAGDQENILAGLRIGLGERLSGWVAANKKTIVNSDPALDLGELTNRISPRLVTSLSVPLLTSDGLLGVLTLYSDFESFTDEHRRAAESFGFRLSQELVKPAEARSRKDPVTGLSNASELPEVLKRLREQHPSTSKSFSLVFVEGLGLTELAASHGKEIADRALHSIALSVAECLESADLLFRRPGFELVALVSRSEPNEIWQLAKTVRDRVRERSFSVGTQRIELTVSTHGIASTSDVDTLTSLVTSGQGATTVATQRKSSQVH
jgi:diguanylate cyclase (GGDEF)-like protein/putative nucleotidyltransferase with HDIG domain